MEKSERFGFNLPSRDGDDLADINQISNNFRIVEDVVPYVDENYDPKSKNPQSGEAVFGAIKTVRNPILDYIVYEIVEDGTVDIVSCDRAIKGDYIIPDTIDGYLVTSIGKSFSPASRWAFGGCENLISIVIPDSVTLIGDNAFSSCYNLEKIVMGNGIVTIGNGAFYDCSALKDIIIPENITTIGVGSFENVDNMADVYYNGTSEQWDEIIVGDRNEPLVNATIHFNYNSTPATKGYVDEAVSNAVNKPWQVIEDITLTEAVARVDIPWEKLQFKEVHIEAMFKYADTTQQFTRFGLSGTKYWEYPRSAQTVYSIMDLYMSPLGRTIFDGTLSQYWYQLGGATAKLTNTTYNKEGGKEFVCSKAENTMFISTTHANGFAEGTIIKIWGR